MAKYDCGFSVNATEEIMPISEFWEKFTWMNLESKLPLPFEQYVTCRNMPVIIFQVCITRDFLIVEFYFSLGQCKFKFTFKGKVPTTKIFLLRSSGW
jgi:hypothetical protein